MKAETFGQWLKRQRLRRRIGLSYFAQRVCLRPSELSSIEHGRGYALLHDNSRIRRFVGETLGLKAGSDQWDLFIDSAYVGLVKPNLEDVPEVTSALDLPELLGEQPFSLDMTPNADLPVRILQAYRDRCKSRWQMAGLDGWDACVYDLMNEAQTRRAAILDEAVAHLRWIETRFNPAESG